MPGSKWVMDFIYARYGIERGPVLSPAEEKHRDWTAEKDKANDALNIVMEWNRRCEAGVDTQFSPTIGAALRARRPWLRLHCPACDQVGEVDLRRIVRPQTYPIAAVKFYCEFRCRGQAPAPRMLGLFGAPSFDDLARNNRR